MRKFVRRAALVAGCALLGIALSGCLSPEDRYMLDAMNGLRASNGGGALQEQEELNVRAQQWAATLASQGRLRHSNLKTLPVPFSRAAENVGYGASVQQVHETLAASPAHRANMLNPDYTGVGIGTARAPDGRVYAVQVFFRR